MPINGTIEKLDGTITGELSKVREVTGKLSAPKARDVPGDYDPLINKPRIEGNVLEGDKTYAQLGLEEITPQEIDEIIFGG